MIVRENLSLYEESYNEGYEQALSDFFDALVTKHPKNKFKYAEIMETLVNSFEKTNE